MQKIHQLVPRLVVERVRQVLRHALETSKPAVAPFRAVGGYHLAVFVELVSIGGKHSRHREGFVLAQLQSQSCAEVAPRLAAGRHVVRQRGRKFVDERYFAVTRRVAVGAHLHFEVVRHRHRYQALLRPRGVAIYAV